MLTGIPPANDQNSTKAAIERIARDSLNVRKVDTLEKAQKVQDGEMVILDDGSSVGLFYKTGKGNIGSSTSSDSSSMTLRDTSIATWDFTLPNFTTDGAAHDIDLSSIIPSGAKLVYLWTFILDDTPGSYFYVYPKGRSVMQSLYVTAQANGIYNNAFGILECVPSRIFTYVASNTTLTGLYLGVRGWWL